MNNFRVMVVALLAAFVLCAPDEAVAGTINGKVTVKGVRSPRNVVVYIDALEGEFKPPAKPYVSDQKNMAFLPHVLPILAGATVDFLNSDSVLHNVLTTNECAEKFNLGTWGKGKFRSYTFKKTDCKAVLLCNVHPEMEGWIVVLQNPYFFKTGKDGVFTIKDVPAGTYTLNVWHKKAKGPSQEVTVPQDGEISLDFKMKRERKR